MADFTADLQNFRPQFPFLEFDPNMTHISQLSQISQPILGNSNMSLQSNIVSISIDNFFNHQVPEFPMSLAGSLPDEFRQINHNVVAVSQPMADTTGNHQSEFYVSNKRKAMDMEESSSLNSSPQVSAIQIKRKISSRRGKRVKSNEEEEKPKEVVHVRARRGQATDSHSLAERVRRGKINERLRCLQDIVPGCYKSMGMAVMLDEIINYVQSLQNQVEFLSMKLNAASTFYDFITKAEVIDAMQRPKAQEARELERMTREAYGGVPRFHSLSKWAL